MRIRAPRGDVEAAAEYVLSVLTAGWQRAD